MRPERDPEPAPPFTGGHAANPTEGSGQPGEAFGTLEPLHPRVVTYWTVGGLVRLLVLGAVLTMGVLPAGASLSSEAAIGSLAGVGGFVIAAAIGLLILTKARYKRFRFAVSDRFLYVRDGVIWHREKVIPVSRMQHVDIQQGPVERAIGLASLSVFTAGGGVATFRLPGLDPEYGRHLRDRVLAARDAT